MSSKQATLALVGLEDPFLTDAACLIKRHGGIDVKYIFGVQDGCVKKLSDHFPGCRIQSLEMVLSRDFVDRSISTYGRELPREVTAHFDGMKRESLFMMDRFTFFPLSGEEKETIFHGYLSFWWNLLRNDPIDCIVFGATPHKVYDYILFHVAKYFGIKTVYLERTLLDYRVFLFEDYRHKEKVPEGFLSGLSNEQLGNIIKNEFAQLIDKESFWLKTAKEKNKKDERSSFLKFLLQLRLHSEYEEAFALNKRVGTFLRVWAQTVKRNTYEVLRKYCESLMEDIVEGEKFVLFSLHFQPERSTCPLGGVYADQLQAIEVLQKSVSKNLKIYVKEHPRQILNPRPNAIHVRSKDFYNRILSFDNVRLIDYRIDNAVLIEKAEFVSTISGSTGWEALLKSKPCITFGFPWYFACNSSYKVDDVMSCRQAIEAIRRKDRKEIEGDVLRFLAFHKNRFVTTTNRHDMAVKSSYDYSHLAGNLAKAIIDRCLLGVLREGERCTMSLIR